MPVKKPTKAAKPAETKIKIKIKAASPEAAKAALKKAVK
jgi:hypothetical protein